MDLSIVLVSWNTKELIAACLDSVSAELARLPDLQAETFVVDNASTDGSSAMLRDKYGWVRLLENAQNVGFGVANNQAMAQASGRYVLLLNSDTEVNAGAFKTLIDCLDAHAEFGAVGPLLLNTDGTFQLSCDPEPTLLREIWRMFHLDKLVYYGHYDQGTWPRDQVRTVDGIKGACMLMRQRVLNEVGHFDPDFFMYSEEIDLCTRIRRAGWQIGWEPRSEIIHHGGQSTKLVAAEMFQNLYRYKTLYFRKHHGPVGAFLYKGVLAAASLARVLTIPLAIRFGKATKRADRQALFSNYRRLLFGLPSL